MENARTINIVFHGRFPSEKAAALWVAKVAEGFGTNGFRTTLIVPQRSSVTGDPFATYRLAPVFTVARVFVLDLFRIPLLKHVAFTASWLTFGVGALLYLKRHATSETVIYANDPQALWLLSLFYRNCFYELHVVPTDKLFWYRKLFRRMRGFITITKWGGEELMKKFGIPQGCILHAPGGVDIEKFDMQVMKNEARQKLLLPLEKKLVLYTGHLYQWKGVDTLAQAATLLPPTTEAVFVGGTEADVASFKRKYGAIGNIHIVGQRPHEEIPLWQKAADVLVLPNTGTKRISKHNTSPMKLFEYMASGVPIVVSDLPSIREVIGKDEAFFTEPDNPQTLAESIRKALGKSADTTSRARSARKAVERYSWEKRGGKVSSFIATKSQP